MDVYMQMGESHTYVLCHKTRVKCDFSTNSLIRSQENPFFAGRIINIGAIVAIPRDNVKTFFFRNANCWKFELI